MILRIFCVVACYVSVVCHAQTDSIEINYSSRKWITTGVHATVYGGSLLVLNEAWYKDYEKRSLHSFDDSREWLQVDKLGHAWSAYHITRGSTAMWKWAGADKKKSGWIGGLSSLGYLTIIEFLDAHTVKWGWSWADMGANIFGTGLYLGQEAAWKEQKFQFKFSFHGKSYEGELKERADDLYGKTWYERMLKDYNGQTYWLSLNLKSVFKKSGIPDWLNISFGYGAEGMFGGFENTWTNKTGNEVDRRDIARVREFYFSPDIDLSRIKTKNKLVRTLLSTLNGFKFPAPALMLNSDEKLKCYALYY